MNKLAFVVLLSACATPRAAEEDDRLSANDRSMPSAHEGGGDRGRADEDLKDDEPTAKKASSKAAAVDNAELIAAAQAAAAGLQEAKRRGDEKCAPLENRPVPAAEERAMGLELAVAVASSGNGLYADGADKAATRRLLEERLQKLAPGDKSAVTAYVQKLGEKLGGAKVGATFVVLDDGSAQLFSLPGGWVFITTGLLGQLGDEADVAGALAHELAHLAARDPAALYAHTRFTLCKIALTGANLVAAGAMGAPGAQDFAQNSRFSKTQSVFAEDDLVAAMNKPDVDGDYVRHMFRQAMDQQRLTQGLELEQKADQGAVPLLAAAGYDVKGLANAIRAADPFNRDKRVQALSKLQRRGKVPPLPAQLKWPKP